LCNAHARENTNESDRAGRTDYCFETASTFLAQAT
jgi:hypothetical protein